MKFLMLIKERVAQFFKKLTSGPEVATEVIKRQDDVLRHYYAMHLMSGRYY